MVNELNLFLNICSITVSISFHLKAVKENHKICLLCKESMYKHMENSVKIDQYFLPGFISFQNHKNIHYNYHKKKNQKKMYKQD